MSLTCMVQRIFSYKIVRYAIVGVFSTLIHLGVALFYLYMIKNELLQANIIAFCVAYIFSYLMQSRHVFRHSLATDKALKYFFVQFFSLLLSTFISSLIEGLNSYFQTLLIIVCMPIVTFFIHKFWTFK